MEEGRIGLGESSRGDVLLPTSPKYPIDHFRCLAACSISADPALPARFCCWACRQPGEGGSAKSLSPSFASYSWHWNLTHARQLHKDWLSLALHGGVTLQNLAWSLLGVGLDDTPLPYHKDALRHLPRTLPPCKQGHNPKIYGPAWNIERPFIPMRRSLPAGPSHLTPTPPSYPPPSHVLPSLGQPLVVVNKSRASLPSPRPPLKSPPPVAPSSSAAGVTSKTSSTAVASPPLQLTPAIVKGHGSRFHTGPVAKAFVRIGWESPLTLWASHLSDEIRSFIFPAENVHAYSTLRERWHLACCKPSNMLQWLLHMEEHSFYLFLVKIIATRSTRSRSSLALQDREKSLAMVSICTDDLRDELQVYRSFRHDDSQLPYVTAVLEHVKAIISLQMPLDKDFTFPLAPTWNSPPTDDKWPRTYYKSLGR